MNMNGGSGWDRIAYELDRRRTKETGGYDIYNINHGL